MKSKFVRKILFWVLIVLLTATTVIPAAAAVPSPINSSVITGDPDGGTITLQPGKSWITYDAGTCSVKCRFDTHLSGDAYNNTDQVPFPLVSGLNIQVGDDSGYTVCFDAKGIKSPQVWAFVDGQWVLLSTFVNNGMICVRGHGNMIFGFFGEELPPSPRRLLET